MAHIVANAFWTAVWKATVSYAISAVTNKLFGPKAKNTSPTYSFGALQTQTNSGMVMALIYGEVKTAGNVIWSNAGTTVRNRLVSFGVGQNKSFSDVRINDNVISSLPGCNYTAYLGDGEQLIDSRVGNNVYDYANTELYDDNVPNGVGLGESYNIGGGINTSGTTWVVVFNDGRLRGHRTVTQKTLNINATQAARAKIVGGLKYDSYLAITATASDKLSSDGYTVTAIVKGRIVKIYTSPTEYYEDWSDNPAWCFLDFMTSVDGCGLDVSANYIPSFLTLASYADELVNSKKRFTFNMTMDERKSRQDWLDEILATCRGYRTYQNGLHGILVDKPELVSQIFNVKPDESIETWWQDNAEDVERLQIEYVDPSYEYTKVVAQADRVQLAGEVTQFRNKIPLTKKISVYGINNFEQASREAWFHLNKAQTCPEWIQYTTNKRALNRSIGDVVGITNPITEVTEDGLPYKRYRIMTMTEPQENKITMSMQEYNPNLYTDKQGSVAPIINVTKLSNPATPPPDVSNIQLAQVYYRQKDGTIISYITGTCVVPDYGDISAVRLEYSIDGGVNWIVLGAINSDGGFIIDNVKTSVSYIVRIKVINRMGLASNGIVSDLIYITGKDNSPPDIETLFVEKMASGVYRLTFTLTDPPIDLAGYKFRYNIGNSSFWDNAIPLHDGLVLSSPFETNILRGGIYTVMGKAVDNSGNESDNVATIRIGIGDPIVNNVIYDQDFVANGFAGTKTRCVVSGGLLVANDNSTNMYHADNNAPMYTADNAQFYIANWQEMIYDDTFIPDSNGELSFTLDADGNAQIFYRERYPYQIYGADSDLMFPDDTALMYKEGPYVPYGGKVLATGGSLYDMQVKIGAGVTQGVIRELMAIVDVDDEYEVLNDIAVTTAGIVLPVTKSYRQIKNVNITIQDTGGAAALTYRLANKNITGPFITLYDNNNIAVAGIIDAEIQGIKG